MYLLLPLMLLASGAWGAYTLAGGGAAGSVPGGEAAADTLPPTFRPAKTTGQSPAEAARRSTDLKDPENLQRDAWLDEHTGQYLYGTKLGAGAKAAGSATDGSGGVSALSDFLETPLAMTREEFARWTLRRAMSEYYKKKNAEEAAAKGKDKFDFTDMKFDLGPANKIFGPGGVRIKTQGSAELKLGANMRSVDNPSLSERNRKVFGFDFDEKINLSLNGKVGDKVNMDFNYNSQATFNFDTQNLKLHYEGKEDEIVKLVEAGNVSLPSQSSLIRGGSALFGIRTDLQFGKLKLQAVVSQKKSSSQSVSSKGGVQLTAYEFSADQYDENRHFFLSHFFRDHYDENMAQLPNVLSGVTVNRIEVWVTNKTGASQNTRSLAALADLGESSHTSRADLWGKGTPAPPDNSANGLYSALTTTLSEARDAGSLTGALDGAGLTGGTDYEKLEQARLLSSSEYKLNASLGYISLRTSLQPDQVLAVAYEYTYRGQVHQVGEFSTDQRENQTVLFVKALKNTACTPQMPNWPLMMKNVYSLGATSVQREKFRMDIKLLSDTSGVYLSYLPEAGLKDKKLLTLLGMDRLDNNDKPNPNGYFDYVEGYTIDATNGRVYFPVVEPFGSSLRRAIGDDEVARRYVFQELYDSTRVVAKQIAEKNKFLITGEYKATRHDEIQLGAMNIPHGSVVVTAGGMTLTEGSDYTVDYVSGIVRILNKSILDAGTSVSVSLESNTNYGMQRKTMFGLNWEYDFTKDFQLGGTIMHLGEKPLTTKVSMGEEALNNTLWGLNLSWKRQSQRLTDWLDKLPLLSCTAPSSINVTAEAAQLIAGGNTGAQAGASYIDDFENSKSEIDISNPVEWTLSSVPSLFPESRLMNDVRSGMNRALLSWYYIDPLFTRRSSSITPGHIKGDLQQLSDPDVREIAKSELFPNKSINYREATTLSVLNLAYYPSERGPYNLDPELERDGSLTQPEKRWGGMMRRLDNSDFEQANIEYIEFWMMDPFIKARQEGRSVEGDLYLNLGEVSEDVLRDGKKFYESGLPTDEQSQQYSETVWGRVPTQQSVTYAFNTQSGARLRQDVGLNGLSSQQERTFPAYRDYLAQVQTRVSPEVYAQIEAAPSADRFHYFRGSDYDEQQRSILDRYKYINNPNGNSVDTDNSPEKYSTAYKTTPDVEDVNQDFTLQEYEKYFQYRVRIAPEMMHVGENFIVDKRTTNPKLRNGEKTEVDWYLFRIPVDRYERRVGNINDFTSVRFMRLFMTGFREPVVLRLATFNLVRGEWRAYEQPLYAGRPAAQSGGLEVSAVNFEENTDKTPVNYVLPPGVSRVIDPGQDQVLQNNEQALALTLRHLASGEARAVYKNTSLDLRRYRHLQLFTHANQLPGETGLEDGQVSLFLRLGSDYKNNFYEYEIPLTLTPEGRYTQSEAGARQVWPEDNMLDIDLDVLTSVKRDRNRQKSLGLTTYADLYTAYDPARPKNKVSIVGNPSLGEVRTVMIGVRNNSRQQQSVEVWANELRLQEFTNKGGWAARAQVNLQLSDVASVNATGHLETEGFGGLEEGVSQRRDDNLTEYTVTTNVEAGRFLPKAVKLKAPIYYSYSKERRSPRYNPLDGDMEMSEALDGLATKAEQDSLRDIADRVITNKNFSISGLRFDISTKRQPMPYDPANFTFGYAHSSRETTGETTAWERDQDWKWNAQYNYSPALRPFQPWAKMKSKSKWAKFLKEFGLNFAPQNLTVNSDISRRYYELQERDMENLDNHSLPLTWASDYLWNRSFSLRWDLTKALQLSFQSGTNAEIEQPYTPVNKDLYPDRYTAWKDSVRTSLLHFGTPLAYQQQFSASWQLPLAKLPALDWMTSDVKYSSSYNWNRGAELTDGTSMGGTLSSQRNVTGNARLRLDKLYDKVPFLKKANQRFASAGTKKEPPKVKPFIKEVQLRADTTLELTHTLKSRRLKVTALRPDGTRYPLRYRVDAANRITLLSQDTTRLKITITPKPGPEQRGWYKAAQLVARALMMVRSASVSYSNKYSNSLPGFLPQVGDMLGQTRQGGAFAPGLAYAFGFTGDGYIRQAADRGWLLMSDSVITPAVTNLTEDLQVKATLEPLRDLKIDLNASRTTSRNRSIQYMFEGMPTVESGSFTMTTISLGSAFSSQGSATNGYANATFSKFLTALDDFQALAQQQYAGTTYPRGTVLAGQPYDPANGTVGKYSAQVMIPAFLSTYAGGGHSLDLFPALSRLLPNWTLSYSGLAKLPRMKRTFRSFNINHAYKSIYSVGSYSSFSSYRELLGGVGFIADVASGLPTPSCPYDISTVSINESFSPLLGVDMTFRSGLTAKAEMRRTRVLTLSMTSAQITEARSNDLVFGLGYKIADLKLFQPKKTVRSKKTTVRGKNDKGEDTKETATTTNSRGFANALSLRFDLSLRNQSALQRDLLTALSQATSGQKAIQVSFSADYALSRLLTLTAYYDRQKNQPLLTSSSYPTTTQDFGLSVKFMLNR